MSGLKKIILYLKYGYKSNSLKYSRYLEKKGCTIGRNVKFYSPWTISVDTTRPWLIEIGNNVNITANCTILTHGYDWSVLKCKYGDVLGSSGKVKIGNNVFIGNDTTILKGVTIGDNVIIGAKSLVNKDCLEEGVYAGNPVRFISTIEDYYKKRKNKQLEEATELVTEYYKKYRKYPPKEYLREFFWIFEEREKELINEFYDVMKLEGNFEKTIEKFKNTKPLFNGYEEFLENNKLGDKNGSK